ncbi:hypothetical protein JCGZ_03759 [Jatropha curcas]|uniref:Uncharacterized protein n=1 Tax=Jatropha curcas TaxID=180498 RepID=A0A067L8G4_JATCU|nr:hypothetical protein JCGZ_03759 [Jatropha curcas]
MATQDSAVTSSENIVAISAAEYAELSRYRSSKSTDSSIAAAANHSRIANRQQRNINSQIQTVPGKVTAKVQHKKHHKSQRGPTQHTGLHCTGRIDAGN